MKDTFWDFFTQNGSVEAYLLYKGMEEQVNKKPSDRETVSEYKREGTNHTGDVSG